MFVNVLILDQPETIFVRKKVWLRAGSGPICCLGFSSTQGSNLLPSRFILMFMCTLMWHLPWKTGEVHDWCLWSAFIKMTLRVFLLTISVNQDSLKEFTTWLDSPKSKWWVMLYYSLFKFRFYLFFFLCLCVFLSIYMWNMYINTCIYTHVHTYQHTQTQTHICIYVYVCMVVCVWMHDVCNV